MVSVLLGQSGGLLFGLCYIFSSYCFLVANCSIFASSLASTIPIFGYSTCNIYDNSNEFGDECWKKYWFYLLVLLVVMTGMVLAGLKVQGEIQAVMSIMRFIVFFFDIRNFCVCNFNKH